MKARLPIYASAAAWLTIGVVGDASAFTRIGALNNMHGHRTAPPTFHSIQIIKPPLVAPPIKIGVPKYQARPRQKSIDPTTQRPRP